MIDELTRDKREPVATDFLNVARIGLIGDVHTEDRLLDRAVQDLRARGAERILCVGDIVDGPGDLERCCALLQRHDVLAVRGNHDRWLVADLSRDLSAPDIQKRLPLGMISHLLTLRKSIPESTVAYLSALPATHTIATSRGTALLCHGLGTSDTAFVNPDDDTHALNENVDFFAVLRDPAIQIVLNGHTHRRMVRHFEGLSIVNAGTLHRHQDPGAVLLDLPSGEVSWLRFGNGTRTEIATLGTLPSRSTHA